MVRAVVGVILALGFGLPAAAAGTTPAFAPEARAAVLDYAAADAFSGAVLVARDGKPILRLGAGLADREWDIANTPQAKFRLGSITKQFTAAAILQLAEAGKLGLDDPISKYYAAAPEAWKAITIRNLLTHTSGIPSYTAIPDFFDQLSRLDRTPEEIIALTRDKPLEFAPGARFAYDNTGYVILGYVIEKVSGQTYAAYLQDHIFGPLGLRDTGYDVSTTILPHRAAGYTMKAGKVINAPFLAMSLPYAAGSLYSTVDDLLTWNRALLAGKVISPASVKAMFTDYGFHYGFGQFVDTRDGHRVWEHSGGINGFSTMLAAYPDDGLTVIVLSNLETASAGLIARRLAALYFHPEIGAGPGGPPTPAELDRYVGRYRLDDSDELAVTREGTTLYAQRTNGGKLELRREVGRSYFVKFPFAVYAFAPGDRAAEVTVSQGGRQFVARRID